MELGTEKDIRMKINEVLKEIKSTGDKNKLLLLENYIGDLYSALTTINGEMSYPIPRKMFGTKSKYRTFVKETDILFDKFDDNFIKNKEFHSDLFYKIFYNIEDLYSCMLNNNKVYCGEVDSLSEEEFCTIYHDFLKSIGLENLYDEIMNKSIYCCNGGTGLDNYNGLALFNPFNGDSGILIRNFDYNIESMFTLTHETGHIYDLKSLLSEGKNSEMVNYAYLSLFGEVMSKLFERLFLEYLITNNIYRNIAIDKLIDMEIFNHSCLINGLILSLIRSEDLYLDGYEYLSDTEIINKVRYYFVDDDFLIDHLSLHDLNLSEDISYAYGDIISMKLKEVFKNSGFNSSEFKYFMKHRTKIFNPFYIRELSISADDYYDSYVDELSLIKK